MKTNLVDQLGALKAQIVELEQQERALAERVKQQLLRANVSSVEGDLFRATLTVTERVSVDSKAVASRFPQPVYPELYKSNLVSSLRVTARTGELLAA